MDLALAPDDPAPVLLLGERSVARAEVKAQADVLAGLLARSAASRVMAWTDDPARLLAAIDACHARRADLWIVPASASHEAAEEIVARFGIEVVLHHSSDVCVSAREGAPSSGRIHLMTSGTTGRPKIAAHTLASLVGRVQSAARAPTNRRGRWLLTYQVTAFAGIQVLLTAALSEGVLVAPRARTPDAFAEAARRHRATHISGTPTFWRSFLCAAAPGALTELRQITLGGEAVDQATLDRLRQAFPGARITHIYASTEAGAVFAVHDGRTGFPAVWLERGVDDVALRVREGMLELKTPRRMQRYVSDTASPETDDGWLRTGDLVAVDGDRVRFLGRQDDVINVGGAKVHPHTVESFLLGLDEVAEARVRAVANPITGFIVGAEVVVKNGVDAQAARQRIIGRCHQGLQPHEVPRALRIVDTIKVLESGKKG